MAQNKSSKSQTAAKLKVTLRKSTIGFNKDQAKVVEGMGLRRIGHSVKVFSLGGRNRVYFAQKSKRTPRRICLGRIVRVGTRNESRNA